MRIGGRFKLLENFSENLMYVPELADHHSIMTQQFADGTVSQSLELEFDQSDTSIFYISTPGGLYKFNRRD
jgi:hypothetical protein